MMFEVACPSCGKIIRDKVPIPSKEKTMQCCCTQCNYNVVNFYAEGDGK